MTAGKIADLAKIVGLFAVMIAFAFIFGVALPFIGPKWTLVLVALFGSIAVAAVPPVVLVVATLLVAGIVLGPVRYFAGTNLIWGVYGLCVAIGVQALLRGPKWLSHHERPSRGTSVLSFLSVFALYFTGLVVATTLSPPNMYAGLVELRNQLFPVGLLLLFALWRFQERDLRRVYLALAVIAAAQGPLAVYQYFWISKQRTDAVAWDAVVGTFPGSPDAGGDSGAMAIYAVIAMFAAVAMYREKLLPMLWTAAIVCSCAVAVVLAEVKVLVALMPIAIVVGLATFRGIRVRDVLIGFAVLVVGVVGWWIVYRHLHLNESDVAGINYSTLLDRLFGYSLRANVYTSHGEVGRLTAIEIWWRHIQRGDLLETVAGYGLGASNTSEVYLLGRIGREYFPWHIDASAAVKILWESGVLGLTLYVAGLMWCGMRGISLSRKAQWSPLRRVSISSATVTVWLVLFSLPYNKAAVGGSLFVYLLLMASLGWIAQQERIDDEGSAERASGKRTRR